MLAMAFLAFSAVDARADIIFLGSFDGSGIPANPDAELAALEDFLTDEGIPFGDLIYLARHDAQGPTDGPFADNFDVDFNDTEADVSWDLTGEGVTLSFILVKYGDNYDVYGVTDAQEVQSDGTIEAPQGISHISFFGEEGRVVTPEPTTLLLLGTGLAGLALLRRKR